MGADLPPANETIQEQDVGTRSATSSPSSSSTVDSMNPVPPTPRRPAPPTASTWCSDWLTLLRDCCTEDHRTIETELQPPLPAGSGSRIDSWGPFFYIDDEVEDARRASERRVELGLVSSDKIGRYCVINDIMQNQRRSGVAYRYTKSETDKVRREGPVPWGTIVQGIDEGDGWLRVGHYYLPFSYQGVSVLTPVLDTQESSDVAHADKLLKSTPKTLRVGAVSANSAPVAKGMLTGVDKSASLPVDRRPPTPAIAQAHAMHPPGSAPHRSVECKWCLRPSVGTWLRKADNAQGEQRSIVAEISSKELIDGLCESPELFADVLGKPAELDDDMSPSTCPPDSPFATPMSELRLHLARTEG